MAAPPVVASRAQLDALGDLMPTDDDLLYEEELLRNPYSLKMWWRYIQARTDASARRRYVLYERALKALPGSYKLLLEGGRVTATRRAFDRALAALPITQHDRVWPLYLRFVGQPGMPVETSRRVYRRYLQLEPGHVEEYIAYCRAHGLWGEVASRLAASLNDDTFRSLEGKTKHQLWLELCDAVTRHPREVVGSGVDVEGVLRGGIRRFTEEVGRLWTSLADYYIRRAMFEKARDVYEEGLTSVVTVGFGGLGRGFGCAFAKFYERHGDVPNARIIFDKAVQVAYRYVDDLASVWCEWAEMELRHNNYKRALDLMRRATAKPQRPRQLSADEERALPVQERLYRSSKLWSFYADLEESLGTLESACRVYDGMLELRIATPQVVLNYALMLQEAKHWEDAFRVYEKGVALFKYPHVGVIWAAYLAQFVARYGGAKLERARDLFESALADAPPDKAKPLFLEYARLEEQHGLARRAMEVYARALQGVTKEERLPVLDVYVARAAEFFGVAKVREIYEAAIESQPPHDFSNDATRQLCVRYAALERKLGEVDRARAVLAHGASLADPRRPGEAGAAYWAAWNDFEVRHGNEDTFKEMLRIKRSVAASYAQSHIDTGAQLAAAAAAAAAAGSKRPEPEGGHDSMAALEAAAEAAPAAGGTRLSGFVSAGVIQQGQGEQQQDGGGGGGEEGRRQGGANPEEIELGGGEEEEEGGGGGGGGGGGAEEGEEAEDGGLEERAVPAAVFGSLAAAAGGGAGGEGALERFKKRRVE
ncbi:pre-mRNA-splicing factor [Raphidocelis subcapitata]|uniref:Pre-mRNA-splicing factor n=1 Tax=Raphidocelis subcapitata TaxID=307507 RepID=A0A2V0NRX8_9CHLO|nr:pre-mRNA-splicing factor [Raphidocelis subcapitata]|eukprot:GBF90079.1 pre-mRNA-splicing factor [Raphidocelis subcapitata]